MALIFFFIICLLGSIVQGSIGFGFAILSVPLLSFLFPIKNVIPAILLVLIAMTLQISIRLRKHINFKFIVFPLIFSLFGRTLGINLLMYLDTKYLSVILGIVLILISVYSIFFNKNVRIKTTAANGILAGTLSGITAGMFNMGGPPLVLYYYCGLPDKEQYNASLQVTFLLGSIYSLVLHLIYGNINTENLALAGVGIIAGIIGSAIGLWIFSKINREVFSKVIYCFMFFMGIILFF